jgi:hypothetical protein
MIHGLISRVYWVGGVGLLSSSSHPAQPSLSWVAPELDICLAGVVKLGTMAGKLATMQKVDSTLFAYQRNSFLASIYCV